VISGTALGDVGDPLAHKILRGGVANRTAPREVDRGGITPYRRTTYEVWRSRITNGTAAKLRWNRSEPVDDLDQEVLDSLEP